MRINEDFVERYGAGYEFKFDDMPAGAWISATGINGDKLIGSTNYPSVKKVALLFERLGGSDDHKAAVQYVPVFRGQDKSYSAPMFVYQIRDAEFSGSQLSLAVNQSFNLDWISDPVLQNALTLERAGKKYAYTEGLKEWGYLQPGDKVTIDLSKLPA
ncbi:MAG: hypothetical protein K0S08_2112 [Gammaproteobacteria bacterium]|jgi:hypothetical protein|nr:hypothetical protein [Gammaproteobacteria bacterium]